VRDDEGGKGREKEKKQGNFRKETREIDSHWLPLENFTTFCRARGKVTTDIPPPPPPPEAAEDVRIGKNSREIVGVRLESRNGAR